MKRFFNIMITTAALLWISGVSFADANYSRALKRAQFLLNGTIPTDAEFAAYASSNTAYRDRVRELLNHDNFYNAVLRYHERLLGIGLPDEYLEELISEEIDNKKNKFARIRCERAESISGRFTCHWIADRSDKDLSCPVGDMSPASVFWYPGMVAWVCPSIKTTCGNDLSRCFIEYSNENEAKNAELGTTEIFDSRFAVIKSLARQPSGLAAAIVTANYPYTKILEPGLTAVDGAIAHFYRQNHQFDIEKLNIPPEVISIVDTIPLTDTKFKLVYTGSDYAHAGIISTFAYLRRFEKNRTRANELYERLLCQKFFSEPPASFPQDPGNLRTAEGCKGCHARLDPLADFFLTWGEGGELYSAKGETTETFFGDKTGSTVADLAGIIISDDAFASCTVENVWSWLIGREFYESEAELRRVLTNYFLTTNYSFKELVYALTTHPVFTENSRSDAEVLTPLSDPPLGEPPGGADLAECETTISYAADIEPNIGMCATSGCHVASNSSRQNLETKEQWSVWADSIVQLMASGNMPLNQNGPPRIGPVFDLKEAVRCWIETGKND